MEITGETVAALRRVRWIVGGTGAGKSTVARELAARYGVAVFDGDRAEGSWARRADPVRQPRLTAQQGLAPGEFWAGRTAAEVLAAMPSLHGEMTGFLVADLLERVAGGGPLLVDWFGLLPDGLAPLLADPAQAVCLVPTPAFREAALRARYADPARARANWGDHDPAEMLARRLERDLLWDEQVRLRAARAGLTVRTVDGSVGPAALAEELAAGFGWAPAG
ncbi:hypothetical protein ACIRBX_03525 [Kitasatospora sp. NPDC096147]|uniref:hypothetical protein n=1 Tax=Kitasatospora sp. NPDC096147 TaxID=3364093 RepID=UPI00380D2E5C